MRIRWFIFGVLCGVLGWAQTAQNPQAAQKAAPAPKLSGFPFQDESLHYSVKWPSGLPLGDVNFTAHRTTSGWTFQTSIDAGVPGFTIGDQYRSAVTPELCSTELERNISHAGKRTREKTMFDARNGTAHRATLFPEGGGTSDFSVPSCPRDALAFLYFVRAEMGQGRVAPPQQVYFGSAYSVQLRYMGEAPMVVDGKPATTDRILVSVKGPKADVSAEVLFARDAARTPVLVKLPLSMGTFTMELVR